MIPPGIDDESELRWLLEKAMDERHAVGHDEYANIIDKWPMFCGRVHSNKIGSSVVCKAKG